ncbi:MAG: response regulator transcription factor [Treponema sp.]|jgi:NarL family two-component system response regulator LiaR|nr:response regulator transcription factor [Treponema sp.]
MEVMLIDDHPMVNAGIVSILEDTGMFTVCAQAQTLAEAAAYIENCQTLPRIIILDLMLGEDNGLDFFPLLEKQCTVKKTAKPPVLVCSAIEDIFKIQTTLKLGAAGFLSKTGGKAELLKALDTILCGNIYISGELNVKLTEAARSYSKFSNQEIAVINLIKQNKTNKQIAEALGINLRTVENYISKIYFKTGFSTREEIMQQL